MKISIITINYRNARGLEETINSVISQTYQNIEYVVIDGGSDDESKAVLGRFKENIVYWVSEPDTGVYNAMNKGIKAATGDYCLFINSGDLLFHNQVIEQAVNFNLDCDLVYGDIVCVEKGLEKKWTVDNKLSFETFYKATIPHPGTFIKRSLFELIGLYNERNKIVSDWEFFMLATCKYNCTYKHINLILTRFFQGGISSDPKNYELLVLERTTALRAHFPLFIEDYEKYELLKEDLRKVKTFVKFKRFFKNIFKQQ